MQRPQSLPQASPHRAGRLLALLVAPFLVLAACSSDDEGESSTTEPAPESSSVPESSTSVPSADTLHILVTNDDGIDAEGIDELVNALVALPDTEVTVVAPAENQSGSSDDTTPDPVAEPAETAAGVEGTAVDGRPADAVAWALAEMLPDDEPNVVISGINEGQNIGPLAALSGTVGAARTAARAGIPALAVSQGLLLDEDGEPTADYESGVDAVLEWLDANRDDLLTRDLADDSPAIVTMIDIPTCPTGSVRGTVEVPLATEDQGVSAFDVDCESTDEDPPNDVIGFVNGFVVVTIYPVDELDSLLASLG